MAKDADGNYVPDWAAKNPSGRKAVSSPDFDSRLTGYLSTGWKVISDGPTGVQLEGPKRLKTATKVAYAIGFLTIVFFGIGFLILIAAYIDDRNTKPETFYLRR